MTRLLLVAALLLAATACGTQGEASPAASKKITSVRVPPDLQASETPTPEATDEPTEEATPRPTEEATPRPTEEATPRPAEDEPTETPSQTSSTADEVEAFLADHNVTDDIYVSMVRFLFQADSDCEGWVQTRDAMRGVEDSLADIDPAYGPENARQFNAVLTVIALKMEQAGC